MDDTTRGGDGGSPRFAAALRRLKREGARLLVTGEVNAAVHARQTRLLLGSPREERVRVLALVGGSSPSRFLPDGVAPTDDDVAVVTHGDTRSTAADVSSTDADVSPSSAGEFPTDRLDGFSAAVQSAVDCQRTVHGPLSPAELRVGVVGAGGLLDGTGVDRVTRTLDALGECVVDRRGMFHCHVSGPVDAPETAALGAAFDARIDLRQRDGLPPEQRWTLPALDESSEWMLL
ncbi:DUF7504 family protein [Halomarina rubra]|uniref:Uncharacterized protein n=1 Tax=Halomarina rubra TaxID=2071873 RepID=A0ABD6AV96_9EURY|nr:hypothetical protein [Halomarina rubra]